MPRTTSQPWSRGLFWLLGLWRFPGSCVCVLNRNGFLVKVELFDYVNNSTPGMRFDPFFGLVNCSLYEDLFLTTNQPESNGTVL